MSARYSTVHRQVVRETNEVIPRGMGLFVEWQCPRCSWFRARTNSEAWDKTVIPHPNYGNITNYDAYNRDIASHDCEITRQQRVKYGIPLERKETRYEAEGTSATGYGITAAGLQRSSQGRR